MIYKRFDASVYVVSGNEVGELLRWAWKHELVTFNEVMERLRFIENCKADHKCDERCAARASENLVTSK